MFLPHNPSEHGRIPVPATMWELREDFLAGRRDNVWAVFRTHEEAAAALTLTGRPMSTAPALECDLEPFHKLHRVLLRNLASSSPAPTSPRHTANNNNTLELSLLPAVLSSSSSPSDLRFPYLSSMPPEVNPLASPGDYTLSSNPPNPKTSFRLGDWICASPNCAAHNFGRNLACIGCGCPRSSNGNGSGSHQQHQHQPSSNPPSARAQPSPRFNTMSNSNSITYYSTGPSPPQNFQAQQQHLQAQQQQQQQQQQHPQQLQNQHQQPHLPTQQHTSVAYAQPQPSSPFVSSPVSASHVGHPPKSTHPLLTPSGRAFAIGGKVQNISNDPLNPCIMYWPDNEPFPEQGQIRPSNLAGVAPPILNTGNRGPISHQPGDWVCQKCNYLNWRRRKVCQTCLPYAEGNGDSISAAVQAERIALLTSVLSQTQLNSGSLNVPITVNQAPRSHSLTPPQTRRPFIDFSPPQPVARPVHRSQSHLTLSQQYAAQQAQSAAAAPHYIASSPIYQTSGNRQPSPLYSTGPDLHRTHTNTNFNAHNMNHLAVNGHHVGNANTNVNIHAHAQNNATMPATSNTSVNDFNLPSVSVHAPAPLLPSFLQDIVQSPALSPTSTTTSSADLSSIEEYEDTTSPRSMFPRARGDSGSSDMHSPIANIWRLDGEESKSLSVFPLATAQEPIGGRKNSGEKGRM
ncbi:hypothetical protein CPB84DRAFT_998327 [Gymnopilus junonius]|uniref:RanBP2-type domain-containing protein n=1 Tax=Gymnopilus junonius TaxID=109634 RepID=A0A9P5TMA9_GYMJU|nr:hypothetical protein CPB84DRAFT_998327 [Gymnopilus junonius]